MTEFLFSVDFAPGHNNNPCQNLNHLRQVASTVFSFIQTDLFSFLFFSISLYHCTSASSQMLTLASTLIQICHLRHLESVLAIRELVKVGLAMVSNFHGALTLPCAFGLI